MGTRAEESFAAVGEEYFDEMAMEVGGGLFI